MRLKSARRAFVHAIVVLLAASLSVQAQDNSERRRYDEADAAFNGQHYPAAATAFEPPSGVPPINPGAQAHYKLACVHLLQGKPADAEKAFKQLVETYGTSPWARLTLRTVYNEDQLFQLANETRLRSLRTGHAQDAATSVELYQLLLEHFPNTTKNRGEIFYKMGNHVGVLSVAKDSGWAKLALVAAGGPAVFREHMEDLPQLTDVGDEGTRSFSRSRNAPCLAWTTPARRSASTCADAASPSRRTMPKQWRRTSPFKRNTPRRNTPRRRPSGWQSGSWTSATSLPRGPLTWLSPTSTLQARVCRARQWAGWLDGADAAWQQLETALAQAAKRLTENEGGVALRLRWQGPDPSKTLDGRVAFQDAGHVYFRSAALHP